MRSLAGRQRELVQGLALWIDPKEGILLIGANPNRTLAVETNPVGLIDVTTSSPVGRKPAPPEMPSMSQTVAAFPAGSIEITVHFRLSTNQSLPSCQRGPSRYSHRQTASEVSVLSYTRSDRIAERLRARPLLGRSVDQRSGPCRTSTLGTARSLVAHKLLPLAIGCRSRGRLSTR